MDPNRFGDEEEFEVSGIPDAQSQPLGQFIGVCTNLQKATSKAGNDMWVFDFGVISDLKGDTTHAGRNFSVYCALTTAALWKLDQTLNAIGIASVNGRAKFKKSQVVGVYCVLEIAHDEYEGRKTAKISDVFAHPSGAGYRPPDSNEDNLPF